MPSSNDIAVLEDLIETLEDGNQGFEKVAERLDGDERSDIAGRMRQFAGERRQMAAELRQFAATSGVQIEERGSVAGALHRSWISLKDALTGDDAHAVLAAAEEGEDHAVAQYRDALDRDISDSLREVISRQMTQVGKAHDEVRGLRDRVS